MAAGWSKLSLFDQCPRRPGTCHHFCTTPSSESALLFLLLCWLWVMWWLGGEFKAVIFSKFWNLTLLNWGPLSGNNSAGILNCLFNYVISQPKAKVTRFEFVSQDIVHKIILYASNASCYLDPIPPWSNSTINFLVEKSASKLAPIIACMVNTSTWKTALIVPLLKTPGHSFQQFSTNG